MICQTCHGRGYRVRKTIYYRPGGAMPNIYEPCPDCGGSGISSCCDAAGAGIADGGKAERRDE